MTDTSNETTLIRQDVPDTFAALQSNFTFNRRQRPPPIMHTSTEGEGEERVPLKQPKLQKRESKGGLREMFTRNKGEKAVVSPVKEEPSASSLPERSLKVLTDLNLSRSMSMKLPVTAADSTPATPATPSGAGKFSRMTTRSKPTQGKTPAGKSSPKSTKSSAKSSIKPPTRSSAAWDPPPLFQAYPQAIKHAQLLASTLSADSILRISNHKRNNSLRDEIAQIRQTGSDQSTTVKKTEKARAKHKRQISGSISKADWTQKIFVLVTSGYLLQYSGEGSFDRLPEKMMQLGKDSVAFASDVIPGKHWVLQVSQAMDADGTPAADSRSLLSRLAFRGADYRRTATSLLLVLNSAEEMDSWISAVRREIEGLGGKKHASETGKPKPDDKVIQLKAQPSHRYLVRRDPSQFASPTSPQLPSFGPPSWVKEKDNELQQKLEDATVAFIGPHSGVMRPSTDQRSVSNSITSHDERQLESLRDSSNRFSYMSSGQRTLITSQGSSRTSSPTHESVPSCDEFPPVLIEEIRPRPNASAISERRRSMQTVHVPALESHQMPKSYRHSTYFGLAKPNRSHSPVTPNFSVPNSSSKRYSAIKSPSIDAPPMPTVAPSSFSRPRDTNMKAIRKAPPTPIKVAAPPFPVKNAASPRHVSNETSFQRIQHAKPKLVDIPPSPVSTVSSPTEKVHIHPHQVTNLAPLNSPEMSHIDFQFPRRFSSMQTLRKNNHSDPPSRASPLASPGLTKPPSASLPLPEAQSDDSLQNGDEEMEKETLSSLPVLANTKIKLRRPMSMQVRASSLATNDSVQDITTTNQGSSIFSQSSRTPSSGTSASLGPPTSSDTSSQSRFSPAPMSLISPSLQRLKEDSRKKALANRRSMPTLVNGPPPAPPPDCALPPLPPGTSGLRNPMGVRNSVRV